MKKVIYSPKTALQGNIFLPSSKSISNRMLMINALAGGRAKLSNLSCSDDSLVLSRALEQSDMLKDIGHAGTAMRFLTAYLCTRQDGPFTLTGSERMKQRPIGPLLDALRHLGADISCTGREGYPPLEIKGGLEKGGEVEIDAGISSQFISALMMIAPALKEGLEIRLKGRLVSETYTRMTASLMEECGVKVERHERLIRIAEGSYALSSYEVEADWSAASYWYEAAALLPGSDLLLRGLRSESLQGDSILQELFSSLNVESREEENGIRIMSTPPAASTEPFEYDFTLCPDLVQTMAVTACAMGRYFRFTGCSTLRVKETDRIAALQKELGRLGYVLHADEAGEWLQWNGAGCEPEEDPLIETYHDHRMAMAFAPLSIPQGQIRIGNPAVVTKSYPSFWEDMEHAGFGF